MDEWKAALARHWAAERNIENSTKQRAAADVEGSRVRSAAAEEEVAGSEEAEGAVAAAAASAPGQASASAAQDTDEREEGEPEPQVSAASSRTAQRAAGGAGRREAARGGGRPRRPMSADAQKLYDEGRCFRCREKGHTVAGCPVASRAPGKVPGRLVAQEALRRLNTSHSSPPTLPVSNYWAAISPPETRSIEGCTSGGRGGGGGGGGPRAAGGRSRLPRLPRVCPDAGTRRQPRRGAGSGRVGRRRALVVAGQLDRAACFDMLIDTGASCSFIRRDCARQLGLQLAPLSEPVTVTLADDRKTVATHEVRVDCLRVYGAAAPCSLLVLDGLSNDVIVGLSWQRAARLTIQLGEQYDTLNGRPVRPGSHTPATAERTSGSSESPPSRQPLASKCASKSPGSCQQRRGRERVAE